MDRQTKSGMNMSDELKKKMGTDGGNLAQDKVSMKQQEDTTMGAMN